ncbi:hypothetical protein NK983_28310, partial [Salmonella enterica subsp. enterica serovar Typhimurium]|nr:hypothetical protein [Salmonella enterica subsp. enterica serovar Typhimurium]
TPQNFGKKGATPIEVVGGVIDPKVADSCVEILQTHFFRHLKRIASPIDPGALSGMKKNYSEKLPKTLTMKTLELGVRKTKTNLLAQECGLM